MNLTTTLRDAISLSAFVCPLLLNSSDSVAGQTASKAVPSERTPDATPAAPSVDLPVVRKPWTGDLDGMVKRRVIRVLVPHSKTHYFVERGQPRGIAYESMTAFGDELNKKRGNIKVIVVFLPTMRDKLIPDLLVGLGT
jgi:hypothetical protein